MRKAVLAALLGAASVLLAPASWARGQLQVAPTLVELAPGAPATRLTLSNPGDTPVAAQVRVFAWTQVGGEDRLGATGDLALSPAIALIAPGASQVVRVVRLGAPPDNRDASYRIVVDELPIANAAPQAGVQLRLRFVVPVYVHAAKASQPALRCLLQAADLACINTGGQAAQLGATRLVDAAGHAVSLTPGLFGYVLPASERHWALSAITQKMVGDERLETRMNGQPLTITLGHAP